MAYPKLEFIKGTGQAVLTTNRVAPTTAKVRPPHAGNVIVIHGVNDVGCSFDEVELGLCAGLADRLGWRADPYEPASYRIPQTDDKGQLLADPDAVFFKRTIGDDTYSPVIPFYWGSREVDHRSLTKNGQFTDRYGNRLDKDYSKGGGPFANATTALPDLWGKGAARFLGIPDRMTADPLRPVLAAPGRMYMVLAAKRLANLANVIRAYDPDDTVSVVAHSQGCLISLLAQAFLLHAGQRPIDTLVLTHPPYSLEETLLETVAKTGDGGHDAAMEPHYTLVSAPQTLNARLQTLARIVKGVHDQRNPSPWVPDPEAAKRSGLVGTRWERAKDRDNRGKVYLYFCPEDMTVSLANIQGIGWQGVPESAKGSRGSDKVDGDRVRRGEPPPYRIESYRAQPLKELGPSFLQRVFTGKLRPDKTGKSIAVPVGLPPHDFVLRLPGEDGMAHADPDARGYHAALPEASNAAFRRGAAPTVDMTDREAIRVISGEALATPHLAEMQAGALPGTEGRLESVDPIDAAISVTSDFGLQDVWQLVEDRPTTSATRVDGWGLIASPQPDLYPGEVVPADALKAQADAQVNAGKVNETQQRRIVAVFRCVNKAGPYENPTPAGKLLVHAKESPDEARLRQQQSGLSARSFHGAIFGARSNHRYVTAYDVAIGQGKAASDPLFYRYLCALADWRLKKPDGKRPLRPGILSWKSFLTDFGVYFATEPADRAAIIEGSCDYYSTGVLPAWLPVLPEGLPSTIVCETKLGYRVTPKPEAPAMKVAQEDEPETIGQYLARNPSPASDGPAVS